MRKFFYILLLLSLFPSPLFAQEDLSIDDTQISESVQTEDEQTHTVTSVNQYFVLELKRGIQNPLNKRIPFTVYITPKIDSSRTQILWNVPTIFEVDLRHPEFVSLQKDQTYSFTSTFKPERSGSYDISVNIISWQFDSNKSNSANYNISIGDNLVVQPVDTMYYVYILLIILAFVGGCALLVFTVIKLIKLGSKKVKAWLTPPY